ncbi:MAG: hypothetical protein EA397_11185 [Deltaproteobacteria bacterium]|nr:MAG: hypothetical protein EA397_11185 [Deltaproteobacteria bacterium]
MSQPVRATFSTTVGPLLLVGVLGLATACPGGQAAKEPALSQVGIDRALFDKTWPMLVVDEEVRAPYQEGLWVKLVKDRDYARAIKLSQGGLASARFHADAAALYRQGAQATANAYVQYFDAPLGQAYDPPEKAHLLMVGKTLRGDLDGARAQVDAVGQLPEDSPVQPWAKPWSTWLAGDATWPPDLSGFPTSLPDVEVGTWPEVDKRPSYTLKEAEPGDNELSIDDPSLLLGLALWHESAARDAAGDQAKLVEVYGARYRLKVEPAVEERVEMPLEFLFGSDYLSALDASFMAAAHGPKGLAAVDDYQGESFTAAAVVAVRGDDGKIDAVKAIDLANDLRRAWKEEQGLAAGLNEGHHPIFADVAVAGLYRNLAYIAELEGNRETSGKLRIAARDVERDAAAAPEGLLALAAWDADNQYTIRGSEIIHQLARRAPSLEVVRTAFDLIGIRVSRSRGGGTPGM